MAMLVITRGYPNDHVLILLSTNTIVIIWIYYSNNSINDDLGMMIIL